MTGVLLKKELRALGPAWLGLCAAILVTAAQRQLNSLSAPIYFLGTCALGALSFGYEYAYDTLPSALMLPVSRRQLLLAKQTSLALALAALLAVTYLVVNRWLPRPGKAPLSELLEPAMVGLFVVPWLTMVFRNAVAGAVFSMAIPLLMIVAAGTLATMVNTTPRAADAIAIATGYRFVVALGCLGAAMMWPTLRRLEALGPRDTNITERWSSTPSVEAATSAQSRLWQRFNKELHLQQLPAALALIYIPIAIGVALRLHGDWRLTITLIVTDFYSAFIAVLAATSVTARERELGTLQWQLSLPASTGLDWLANVALAAAAVVLLGLLLPFGLAHVLRLPLASFSPSSIRALVFSVLGALLLAIYVSSLCRSALSAAIVTVPALLGTYAMMENGTGPIATAIIVALPLHPKRVSGDLAITVLLAVFGGACLWFAYRNHRSLDRSPVRIALQIGALIVANMAGMVLGPVAAGLI